MTLLYSTLHCITHITLHNISHYIVTLHYFIMSHLIALLDNTSLCHNSLHYLTLLHDMTFRCKSHFHYVAVNYLAFHYSFTFITTLYCISLHAYEAPYQYNNPGPSSFISSNMASNVGRNLCNFPHGRH